MIGFEMRLTQRIEHRLSMEQRLENRLSLRLALLNASHGEKFTPVGDCPRCNRKMKPREIMKGFRRDPDDFTTKCPKCRLRFEPRLIHESISGSIEYKFLCPTQTLARLPGMEALPPKELHAKSGMIYQSALVHFGTIRAAFKKIGIAYHFKEERQNPKITRFLGKLPDAVIAEYAGIPVSRIRAMRKKRGIGRWRAE